MGKVWRIFVVFVAFVEGGCRITSPSPETSTQGLVGVPSHVRPIVKMRLASELLKFKGELLTGRAIKFLHPGLQTAKATLRSALLAQIAAIKGLPRSQVKAILESVLKGQQCGGVSCSAIFDFSAQDIDQFLDETLELVQKSNPQSTVKGEIRDSLIASLMRPEPGEGHPWTMTLTHDPEAASWFEVHPFDKSLEYEFPRKPGEEGAFPMNGGLSGEVTWGPKEERQFAKWNDVFDKVEDCAVRGVKKGKVYATFNDCLADATMEEKQFLSAKLVYEDITKKLSDPESQSFVRQKFRAVMDRDGNMQCVMVVSKRPSMDYYKRLYPDMLPPGATQIPALEVQYLLAAPWNLEAQNPKKVKGAGSACLGLAALESKRGPWAGHVLLEGAPSAVPYYEKIGFRAVAETQDPRYGNLPAMWWTPEASEALIPATLKNL